MTLKRIASKCCNHNFAEVSFDDVLLPGEAWAQHKADIIRTIVDKENPDNIVQFCADGMTKITPTQFEFIRRNAHFDPTFKVLLYRR